MKYRNGLQDPYKELLNQNIDLPTNADHHLLPLKNKAVFDILKLKRQSKKRLQLLLGRAE